MRRESGGGGGGMEGERGRFCNIKQLLEDMIQLPATSRLASMNMCTSVLCSLYIILYQYPTMQYSILDVVSLRGNIDGTSPLQIVGFVTDKPLQSSQCECPWPLCISSV